MTGGVPTDPRHYDRAIAILRKKVPLPESEWLQLEEEERVRAFKAATVAQAGLAEDLLDLIAVSVREGLSFDDFEAMAEQRLAAWEADDSPELENVFRTNVMAAYNGGRYEAFTDEETRDERPYWRFDLIDDGRLCEICGDFAGVILPADDPWWQEHIPPIHFQCRCSYSALTAEEARDEGIAAKGPERAAADGFGRPPSVDDWEPDTDRFSPDVREILERRLAA